MTQYTKQPNRWTCGTAALINVLKWADIPVTWQKDGDRLTRKTGAYLNYGAEVWRFHQILQEESQKQISAEWQPRGVKLKDLDRWVKDEDRCAIVIWYHEGGAHAFLCTGKTDHYYTVVNLYRKGPAHRRIHRKKMAKFLRIKPQDNYIVHVQKIPSAS